MSNDNVKKRNWTFLVYPDSAPADWREILSQTGLICAISPLHDKDVNPDGEVKKPHYHVIACYSGPTSFSVVNRLCSVLHSPIPKPLEQVRGMYRYFTHLDNPEKFQYSSSDIVFVNGFDISDFVERSHSEITALKSSIMDRIRKDDILEYSDLIDTLIDGGLSDELDIASTHTLFFDRYISSRRNKRREGF